MHLFGVCGFQLAVFVFGREDQLLSTLRSTGEWQPSFTLMVNRLVELGGTRSVVYEQRLCLARVIVEGERVRTADHVVLA